MGLSTKQVSSDHHQGLDWSQSLLQAQDLELPKPPPVKRQNQNQQAGVEPLKCPRCDSANTKFCYYNNYNKSQPRHFCKACKRHWTKGGTLRNVPVGGGRKNKRIKTSFKNPTNTSTNSATNSNRLLGIGTYQNQSDHQQQSQRMSNVLYQTSSSLIHPPTAISNSTSESLFIGSSLSLAHPRQGLLLEFPFTNSSSSSTFDTNPCSISTSFQSTNVSNLCDYQSIEDPILTSSTINNNATQAAWQMPISATSIGMDMTSYWNWDDLDTLVSTTDLNIPWENPDVK